MIFVQNSNNLQFVCNNELTGQSGRDEDVKDLKKQQHTQHFNTLKKTATISGPVLFVGCVLISMQTLTKSHVEYLLMLELEFYRKQTM